MTVYMCMYMYVLEMCGRQEAHELRTCIIAMYVSKITACLTLEFMNKFRTISINIKSLPPLHHSVTHAVYIQTAIK